MITETFYKYKSFIRFGIVGCINTGVDFFVFTILAFAGADKLTAQAFAYTAGIINSFLFNKYWTFKTKKADAKTEFIKFLPVNLVSLVFTLAGIELLNGVLNIDVFISKIIVTVFSQLINYFGYKFWVFNSKTK
ncbi:MAG: GtrA family protein [Eubacteriales bacterium]